MPVEITRLGPFLAASVAAHAIVLATIDPVREPNIAATTTGSGTEISVRLEAAAPAGAAADAERSQPESSKTAQPAELRPAPAPKETTVARAESLPKPEPESKATSAPPQENDPQPETGESAAPTSRERPNDTLAEAEQTAAGKDATSAPAQTARATIVARLARYFRYPRLAQRRGWEGTVVLSVRVQPDGSLTQIRIRRSSGRSMLDHAAMKSLARIDRLPELADRIGDKAIALEIPVTYRLESA